MSRTFSVVKIARTFAWLVVGATALCGAGCASHDPVDLTVSCAVSGKCFSQSFTHAWSTLRDDGDANVVLVNDSDAAVREVMHVRVLWRPTRDSKSDHDSARNATVHWYVIGKSPGDIIEYDGTAMVVVDQEENGAALSIRDGVLHLAGRRGAMRDPIGQTFLHGTVRTIEDPGQVHKVLNNLRASVAAARNAPGNVTLSAHPESPSSSMQ